MHEGDTIALPCDRLCDDSESSFSYFSLSVATWPKRPSRLSVPRTPPTHTHMCWTRHYHLLSLSICFSPYLWKEHETPYVAFFARFFGSRSLPLTVAYFVFSCATEGTTTLAQSPR